MRRFKVEVSNDQFKLINDLKNLHVILFNAYVLFDTDVFVLTVKESFSDNRMTKVKVVPAIASNQIQNYTVNDIGIILQKTICENEVCTLGLSRVL